MKKTTLLFLFSCLVFAVTSRAEDAAPPVDFTLTARSVLGSLAALADSKLTGVQLALEAVAVSDEARSGDWSRVKPLLAAVQRGGPDSAIWFVRPDGSYSTVAKDLVEGQSLKDRAYFPRTLAGETTVGELVVSKSTGRNVAVVVVPVKSEGEVIGAVGASIFLDSLSESLAQALALPAGAFFYALDANGQTVLHSKTARIFQDPRREGSPTLAAAVEDMLAQRTGAVRYEFESDDRVVLYETSALTRWCFALGQVQD